MKHRRPHRVGRLLILGMAMTLGLVWGLWYVTIGRGPLAGDLRHDFGVVLVPKDTITVRHTFDLTNRTSRPITIETIHSSCGCAAAKPDRTRIEPGESVQLKAALALNKSGLKKAHVTLVLNDDRLVALHMRAIARKERVLSHNEGRLRDGKLPVSPTQATVITLFAEIVDSDDPPAGLTWTAPPDIEVSATEWKLQLRRRKSSHEPARWLCQIKIRPVNQPLGEDAAIRIKYPPDEELIIPLLRRGDADQETGQDQPDPESGSQ